MITVTNKPAVAVDHLSFARGDHPVFRDFSLEIEPRCHVALLGTNGSGKSTLLELILGVLTPDAGTITLAHRTVAFVPQRSELRDQIPMTVRDAVTMGRWGERGQLGRLRKSDHAIINEQLERLGLTDLEDRQLSELSGGQRQRTLIAQAFAQQAPLILLDEPEAGLDAEARDIILNAIDDEVERGTTVILATHELDSARRASRCILLKAEAGGIIADGHPNEILTDNTLAKVFT